MGQSVRALFTLNHMRSFSCTSVLTAKTSYVLPVYYKSKLLQKRPLKCDLSDTLGCVYGKMEIDDSYYLLPPDYSRVESSGVSISSDGMSRRVPASPEDTVEMCNDLSMKYVHFRVEKIEIEEQNTSQERVLTVSEVLMKSSRELAKKQKQADEAQRRPQLPTKISAPKHKKDELYNDVLDFLEERKLYFIGVDDAEQCGKHLVVSMTNVLWEIDGHHEKLNSYSKRKPDLQVISEPLLRFKGYNDRVKKKQSTRLNKEKLKKHGDTLFELLMEPWMELPMWSDIHHMLLALAKLLLSYVQNLEECCARQERANDCSEYIKKWDLINREATAVVDSSFLEVDSALKQMQEYEFLELDEKFLPENRQKRYLFLKNMQLSIPFEMFKCIRGSTMRNMIFLWRLPLDPSKRSTSLSITNVTTIEKLIPEKHSRRMRREFRQRYARIVNITPHVLDDMYQFLSGDTSSLTNEKLRDRLKYMIDHHGVVDEGFAVDLRRLNSGQPSQFEEFWSYMDKVLNEYSEAAADSRRHGSATLPVAASVQDLQRLVIE